MGKTARLHLVFLGIPVRALRPALLSVLITFTLVPIVALPYTADDTVNRNWPTEPLGVAVDAGVRLSREWMTTQGRFFPGGAIYGITMWNILDSRIAYMTYLVLLGILVVGLVAYLVFRATRSALLGAFAAVTLGACMQVRFGGAFDGLASFGGLVPYTLVLVLTASLLTAHVLRGGSRWFLIPSAVIWSLAITAYEVSLLMLPAILLLLYVTGPPLQRWRRWVWATLPLTIPAALQLGVTLWLRRREFAPAPAYQVNLDGPIGTTFGKQFTAALPFAQEGWAGVPVNATLSVLLALGIGLPLILAWQPWRICAPVIHDRVGIGMMAAGLWAWTIPAILAGVTARWQAELVWGQGYVYLPYQFVGFTLMLTGLALLLWTRANQPWARTAFTIIFVVMVIGCAVTAGVNILAAGAYVPGAAGPG